MLLGDELLRAAADVWRIRERTEHEAAEIFERLAADMAAAGVPETLVTLARRCAEDERDHAVRCRRIVDELAPGLDPLAPDRAIRLGPSTDDAGRRALYASVAVGCVTETLSTALLLEMRPHARPGAVRDAIDAILKDEVRHSRLGWAHLEWAAARGDVSWLAPALPKMLRAALDVEITSASETDEAALRACGILPAGDVRRVTDAAIRTTIVPGFERYGLGLACGVENGD